MNQVSTAMAAWNRPGEQPLDQRMASQPTQSRLIDILSREPGNRYALRDALAEACERHLRAPGRRPAPPGKSPSTSDNFPTVVYGDQHGAAYNGHSKVFETPRPAAAPN